MLSIHARFTVASNHTHWCDATAAWLSYTCITGTHAATSEPSVLFSSHNNVVMHTAMFISFLCCACPLFTGVGQGLCPAPDENGTVTGFNGQVRCTSWTPTHPPFAPPSHPCLLPHALIMHKPCHAFIPRARASPPKHSLVRWPKRMDCVNVGVLLVQQRVCNRMRQV